MTNGEAGEPFNAAELNEELTIWATPAVIDDPSRPELGVLPLLTLVPSIMVHTSDDHEGAEIIDVIASTLLRGGFALLSRVEPAALVALPALEDWRAVLGHGGQRLQIIEPAGTLYDGDLGAAPPPGWRPAVLRRRSLVVLVGSGIDLDTPDRNDRIQHAAAAGRVVGAQLPVLAGR